MDFKTAAFVFGFVYTILPIFTWLVLSKRREQQDALWCGGGLLAGSGIILASFRDDDLSYFITFTISAMMLMLGNLSKIQALRKKLGKPWRVPLLTVFFIAYFVFYETTRQIFGIGNALYLLSGGGLFILIAFAIGMHAREIGKIENSDCANWLANTYFLLCGALITRIFFCLYSDIPLLSVTPHYTSTLVSILGAITAGMSSIGYIGMRLEIGNRELKIAELKRIAAESSIAVSERLADRNRRHTINQIAMAMSHELKQPLGAIKLDASFGHTLANSSSYYPHDFSRIFERIENSTGRAVKLLDGLTKQIKGTKGQAAEFDLRCALEEAICLLSPYAKSFSAELKLAKFDQPLPINGDQLQISQILVNIIKNAIEVSQNSTVTIECLNDEKDAVVIVKDSGSGFSNELLWRIGECFYTTKPEGLGLGIAISQELTELHHGSLNFRNATPSGGLVELRLPLYC